MSENFGELRGYFGEIEEYLLDDEILAGIVLPRWLILIVFILAMFAIFIAFFIACTKSGVRMRGRINSSLSKLARKLIRIATDYSSQRRRGGSRYGNSSSIGSTTTSTATALSNIYSRRTKRASSRYNPRRLARWLLFVMKSCRFRSIASRGHYNLFGYYIFKYFY